MRIWLAAISEPVPVGVEQKDRPHPVGAFAEYAARMGHEVVWWTSTFDHFRKRQRFDGDMVLQLDPNLQIRFLRGCGYRRNLSLARVVDHSRIASRFARAARGHPLPDVIVADLPPIGLPAQCVAYGRRRQVPVVLQMRDMWPDTFVEQMPTFARWAVKPVVAPMFWQARAAAANASAILGITDEFVDWGVRRAGRARCKWDRTFPLSCSSMPPAPEALAEADAFWETSGIRSDTFTACFVGALGRQFDIATVIAGARILCERGVRARIVICGAGEKLDVYRRMAARLSTVVLPGRIDWAQAYSLMSRCSVGINPLPNRFDYLASINKKAIDYMSVGLPVVSSPSEGVLSNFLHCHGCGFSYGTGDSEGLANVIEVLAGEPGLLRVMSVNARQAFAQYFDSDVVHERLIHYLEELVQAYKSGTLQTAAPLV